MTQLITLRGQVARVVLVDRRQDRHLIDDFQVEPAVDERVGLFGVVRQQAHAAEAEVLEQLDADAVVARRRP